MLPSNIMGCFTLPETIGPNMIWRQLQHKESKHFTFSSTCCIGLDRGLSRWYCFLVVLPGCLEISINILQHNHLERWRWSAKPIIPHINRPTNTTYSQHACCCTPELLFVAFSKVPPFFWFISLFLAPKKGADPTYLPATCHTAEVTTQVTQG